MDSYGPFLKDIEKRNNFIVKCKGSAVGKPNAFNKSLIILKKALVNHFVENKSIYDTIKENQSLIDYQIIKKRTAKTKYIDADTGALLPDKVLRLFPVTNGGIKILTDAYSKIPDVPDRTILLKENILNMTIQDIPNFDINYYIEAFNSSLESWMTGSSENIDEDND